MNNSWLLWVFIISELCVMYAIIYSKRCAREVPLNYILLTIFTILESILVSFITTIYPPKMVLLAGFITMMLFIVLTVYAITTKRDFTFCGAFLFVCFSMLFVCGIMFAFTRTVEPILFSYLGAVLGSVYIIYDT